MRKLLIQLRIGEKIGIGFGIVGLLFLGVIWQYQETLTRSLADYRQLQDFHAARKDRVLGIETELLQAREAEQEFRLKRHPLQAQSVAQHLGTARQHAGLLAEIDAQSATLAKEFDGYLLDYLQHFQAVEAAWRSKGLDEDSGQQGSFRAAVHDLELMASNLNTDRIYLNLLQIRRGEKDLGLRRDAQYVQRVNELIGQFEAYVSESELLTEVKGRLLKEITTYRDEFAIYAEKVLAGEGLQDGKGPFRDAAHRVEDLINLYYVPDLERDILQLRRREKDYLLRDDKRYVEMVQNQIKSIESRILSSAISSEDRERFISLLHRYRSDFLALVDQNRQIARLTEEMEQVANHMGALVKTNVELANKAMQEMTRNINTNAQQRTVWMLWVIVIAIGLGVFFAVKITSLIVVPMRRMAATLEQLSYTELVDKVPCEEEGRDEVNAMAGYLNILAEHRNRFINWWKNSMNETEACSQLERILGQPAEWDSDTASEVENLQLQLRETLAIKKELMSKELEEIETLNEKILNRSALLQHSSVSRGDVEEQSKSIHYSAELIRKSLRMLSYGTQKQ